MVGFKAERIERQVTAMGSSRGLGEAQCQEDAINARFNCKKKIS